MSLYNIRSNIVRDAAQKLFGKCIQSFDGFDEGITKIDQFINANPNEFVVSVPCSGTSILEDFGSWGD